MSAARDRARSSGSSLVLVTLALTAFGLVMVYSATSALGRARQRQPGRLSWSGRASTRSSASAC